MRAVVLIVALLALSAVALFVVQTVPARIESDLKQRSSQALASANLNFAKVTVVGRAVTLSGEAPGPVAKEEAVKVAGDVWGVATVHDSIVVRSAGLPVTPQAAIGTTDQLAESTPAEKSEPAAPPPDETSSSVLPSVGSLVDPALGSASEEPPPTSSAPEEPPAVVSMPVPPPAPTPGTTPTPSQPEQASVPTPAPQIMAQTTPPVRAPIAAVPPPSSPPAPAPSVPTAVPLSKDVIARGATAGLAAAVESLQQAVAAAPPAYRLDARVDGGRVELQGLVSTPSAQRALVAHMRRQLRHADVVDSLVVAHAKPDKAWLSVARTGLAQLAHLENGTLKLDGHNVAVSGKPKTERDRGRVLAALAELPPGYKSTVLLERPPAVQPVAPAVVPPPPPSPEPIHHAPPREVEPPKPSHTTAKAVVAKYRTVAPPPPEPEERGLSSACRRRFDDVLPRVAVAFESGSAQIESSVGLDEFARIARQCPGARIRLSGHSDTEETAPAATGLSLRRAVAVREALEDRGVAGGSITTIGRGGLRPAFSNATVDGRENNRRVEFAVW